MRLCGKNIFCDILKTKYNYLLQKVVGIFKICFVIPLTKKYLNKINYRQRFQSHMVMKWTIKYLFHIPHKISCYSLSSTFSSEFVCFCTFSVFSVVDIKQTSTFKHPNTLELTMIARKGRFQSRWCYALQSYLLVYFLTVFFFRCVIQKPAYLVIKCLYIKTLLPLTMST